MGLRGLEIVEFVGYIMSLVIKAAKEWRDVERPQYCNAVQCQLPHFLVIIIITD